MEGRIEFDPEHENSKVIPTDTGYGLGFKTRIA